MISLIVSTRNRVEEVHRLLASLEAQSCRDFEVIVVDQNEDDRLDAVLQQHGGLNLRRLRSAGGVSIGRNAGVRAFTGDVVAFPDDDCWYGPDLLAQVQQQLAEHPEVDGVLTGFYSPQGKLMTPKFGPREGPCDKTGVMRCAIAWNLFARARAIRSVGFFREDMGTGAATAFQSGEDLDYPLRIVEQGFRLWYSPQLKVYHPDLRRRNRPARAVYRYAMGVGRVWRLHGFGWSWCLREVVVRSLGGALLRLLEADFKAAYDSVVRAAGELRGYTFRPQPSSPGGEVQPITDDHS